VFRACLFGVLILNSAESAEPPKQPAYHLPLPSGWRKESFTLPPDFAPDMKWKGSEELRFAPGMFKASAPDFFSYAMLFRLPEDAKIDAKTLERELLAYYRGLCSAVSKSKKREVDTKGFTVTITAAKQQPDKRPDSEAVAGYMGELSWIEPFATAKHQTVHLDIQSWVSGSKHRCIFICASAQPESAPVWKILREIRAGCTCQ
jgi:hypothetical protein